MWPLTMAAKTLGRLCGSLSFGFQNSIKNPMISQFFGGGDYWCRLDATDGQALVGFQMSEWPILGGSQVFCGVTNPRD